MNQEFQKEGTATVPFFYIKVLGQTALIEAKVDVDAYANFQWSAREKFCEILAEQGLVYDDLSQEIWMPSETIYWVIYKSKNMEDAIAEPEYVLLSEALKAPLKNRNLINEYLASGPEKLFLGLCKKYRVDLEYFVND